MKSHQLQLLPKPSPEHGGSLRRGKRKIMRPFTPKKPLHLVFRSLRARGGWSFLKGENKGFIQAILLDLASKRGGKIHGYENVGNHLHLIAQFRRREEFQRFLKEFTQRVMFHVTGARKGKPQGRFFDGIAYSRVLEWGRDYRNAKNYLWKNKLESLGFAGGVIAEMRLASRLVPL